MFQTTIQTIYTGFSKMWICHTYVTVYQRVTNKHRRNAYLEVQGGSGLATIALVLDVNCLFQGAQGQSSIPVEKETINILR